MKRTEDKDIKVVHSSIVESLEKVRMIIKYIREVKEVEGR